MVMCKPFGNNCADAIFFSEPRFDKPRCACPCLARDAIFQKRSKPLFGERLAFTSNVVFIDECFLTMSFVKIAKISCICFPL